MLAEFFYTFAANHKKTTIMKSNELNIEKTGKQTRRVYIGKVIPEGYMSVSEFREKNNKKSVRTLWYC